MKTSKQLAIAKLRQVQLKHEEDIIAGRTVHKTITEETKRNGKKDGHVKRNDNTTDDL